MDQVAVGAVDLNAVHSGIDGVAGCPHPGFDDSFDLGSGEGFGLDVVDASRLIVRVSGGRRCTGRDHPTGSVDRRVAEPSGMHDLHDDGAAACVHCVGHLLPPRHLTGCLNARLPQPGARRQVRKRSLCHDQPHRCTLRVVLGDHVAGDTVPTAAEPGHRRHDEPVAHTVGAEVTGGEKIHGDHPHPNSRFGQHPTSHSPLHSRVSMASMTFQGRFPLARSPSSGYKPASTMHWIAREQPEPFEETRNRGRRTRSLLIRPGNGRPCQAASSHHIGEGVVGKILREVLSRRPGESGQSHACTAHLVVSLNTP